MGLSIQVFLCTLKKRAKSARVVLILGSHLKPLSTLAFSHFSGGIPKLKLIEEYDKTVGQINVEFNLVSETNAVLICIVGEGMAGSKVGILS